MKKNLLITLMLMMMSIVTAQADGLIAFPGADGYGKYTTQEGAEARSIM